MIIRGLKKTVRLVINAMQNPRIKAISHPGNPMFPLNYEALVKASLETGTALELNNSSLGLSRAGSRPNCEKLAALIASYGSLLVIGSDAHIAQGVGVFDEALRMTLKRHPETQVVNTSMSRLLSFLGLES